MIDGSNQEHAARVLLPQSTSGQRLPLEKETARFVLVSMLDLLMTWLLLSRPHFTEANPLAMFFLSRWGIAGMAWFKFAMVGLVVVLTQAIAREKLETARRLLNFATVLCAGVVLYSLTLWALHN